MSRFSLYIFLLLTCFSCRKDNVLINIETCSSNISIESETYFKSTAQDLAYLEIDANPLHIGYNEFNLDNGTVNYYLGKLSSIYKKAIDSLDSLHDMIFKYNVINVAQRHSLETIIVRFYNNSVVLSEIHEHKETYSNPFLNKMKNDYWLYPKTYISNPSTVIFTSETPFNISYIERNVKPIEEVKSVSLNGYGGHSRKIMHSKIGTTDQFIFQYGWGDCMAGCFNYHYWKIRVNSDCSVELMEEYGEELPE